MPETAIVVSAGEDENSGIECWALRRIALGYAMAITGRGTGPDASADNVLAVAERVWAFLTADDPGPTLH